MINYITSPFRWFFKLEAASGLLLLISAIIALIISNSNFSSLYFKILESYFFVGINNFGIELSKEVVELDNCKIKNQIFNGVGMRMAILTKLFSQA